MTDFRQYFKIDEKTTFTFGDKTYPIDKSYKITLVLNQMKKEMEKKSNEDENFDAVEANFELIFNALKLFVNDKFAKEIKESDIDEASLMKLFQVLMNIRSGMTEEEAIKKVEEEEKNQILLNQNSGMI